MMKLTDSRRQRHQNSMMNAATLLRLLAIAFLLWLLPAAGYAGEGETDLTALSIEDLLKIEITSAAKKAQRLSDSAAAVFVITQEDIRRSGVTSIPEALRMVPGLEVARIDSSKWAISARGFNGRFANKLLVLVDGRTVYSPLFSGVFWDVQDTMLEDIERIEVIRGPGASLWGANAVNGVINIITKSAGETTGGLVSAGGGTEERYFSNVRYGAGIASDTHLRGYAKYFSRGDFVDAHGDQAFDKWHLLRGGFRLDMKKSPKDVLTVQGDLYAGTEGESLVLPLLVPPFGVFESEAARVSGGNILTRWKHTFSDISDIEVQLYYDKTERRDSTLFERRDTTDFDIHGRFTPAERHEVVWGLGYRHSRNSTSGGFVISLDPSGTDTDLFSAFVQDEMTLVKDRLHFVLGSKVEHNDFTGFELQPTARVLWTPAERHTVWGAVSRAVRTPSHSEVSGTANPAVIPPRTPLNPSLLPVLTRFIGSPEFRSEELVAYEAGYRVVAAANLSFDAATFYNVYRMLRTTEPGAPFLEQFHLVVPTEAANNAEGETYGVELAADWRPLSWWRLQTAYSYLRMTLHRVRGSADPTVEQTEGQNPRHQVSLRSSQDLRFNLEFDAWLRYVSGLPAAGVPGYTTLDARIGWRPARRVEVSVVGQNLLRSRRPEQAVDIFLPTQPTEIPRGVYAKVTWGF